ncbi:MAG TPA: type II secretion system minor pseudopilin GspI [Pseudidiomarina sp.]|nr:type II secretion system minor pseudopilin GspI [Pseudidiomarina sp.]
MQTNLHHRGFTLIEVMAALAIFAMAAIAGISSSSGHLNDLSYMQEKTLARYAASNALARLSLAYPPRDNANGVEVIANQTFNWVADVSDTPTEGIFYVTVRVSPADDPEQRPLHQISVYQGPIQE